MLDKEQARPLVESGPICQQPLATQKQRLLNYSLHHTLTAAPNSVALPSMTLELHLLKWMQFQLLKRESVTK